MGAFVKGDIVVVPFPFSDLSDAKPRPALVLAELTGDDVILCQITSVNTAADVYSVPVSDPDLSRGNLRTDSNIRPNRLFTADSKIISYSPCTINSQKMTEVITKVIEIIRN